MDILKENERFIDALKKKEGGACYASSIVDGVNYCLGCKFLTVDAGLRAYDNFFNNFHYVYNNRYVCSKGFPHLTTRNYSVDWEYKKYSFDNFNIKLIEEIIAKDDLIEIYKISNKISKQVRIVNHKKDFVFLHYYLSDLGQDLKFIITNDVDVKNTLDNRREYYSRYLRGYGIIRFPKSVKDNSIFCHCGVGAIFKNILPTTVDIKFKKNKITFNIEYGTRYVGIYDENNRIIGSIYKII